VETAAALMSYGADEDAPWRHAAALADKIFKGTKPADIPVERPTKLEFWINLKTAKLMGIEIPEKVIALADNIIE